MKFLHKISFVTALGMAVVGTAQATTIFADAFDTGPTDPTNVVDNPNGEWFINTQLAGNFLQENGDDSVLVDDINLSGDSDLEMRIGWAGDEVRVLYNTGETFDLSLDYTLSGDWEIFNSNFANKVGFGAGIAEFDSSGNLVQTLGLASDGTSLDAGNTFGDLVDPTAGETGLFSLTVSSSDLVSAGVSVGNSIGIYFYHDDNGNMGGDANSGKNDVYLIDNVSLVSVPEVSTYALLLSGFVFVLAIVRRNRR